MEDIRAKNSKIRSDSEKLFDDSYEELSFAAFKTGLYAFTLSASDPQLVRLWTEGVTAEDLEPLCEKVITAPAVLHAVQDAMKAVEKELHLTLAVAEEQG